jgi:hypothetical protein
LCPIALFPFFGAASCLKDKTIKTFVGLCHRSHCLSLEGKRHANMLHEHMGMYL